MVTIIFQISDAMPIIRLLIRVIIDLKVNFKYLWNLDEMFFTKQLKDGECNSENYFSNFDDMPKIRLLIRVISLVILRSTLTTYEI